MKKLFCVLILIGLLVGMLAGCTAEPTPTPTPTLNPTPTPTPGPGIPSPDPAVEMPKTMKLQGALSPGSGSDLMSATVEEAMKNMFPDTAFRRFPCSVPDSMVMVQNKELDFSFWGTIGALIPQWRGEWKGHEGEKMQDLRMLGGGIAGLLGHIFYVPADSSIETMEDMVALKPLRIGVGPVGTSSYRTAQWGLAAYGLTYDDIEAAGGLVYSGPLGDTAAMLAEGKLDAFGFGMSHPSPVLQEIDLRRGIRCLPWSKEAIEAVCGPAEHGQFPLTLPGGTYEGTPEDVTILGYTVAATVNKDTPDDLVYNLAAALYHPDTINLISERLSFMTGLIQQVPELTGTTTYPIPFHPGALKYWEERGIIPKVQPID